MVSDEGGDDNNINNTKRKSITIMVFVFIFVISLIIINIFSIGTYSKKVTVEVNGTLTSTSSQNASLNFLPEDFQINSQGRTDDVGHINIYNSSVQFSIYTEILEIWDGSNCAVLYDALIKFDEKSMYMDLWFYPNINLYKCTVLETPTRASVYYYNENPKLSLHGGQIEYEMVTSYSSDVYTYEYNTRLRFNANATVRIIDNLPPMLYYPFDEHFTNYSLDYNSLFFKGNQTIVDLIVNNHSINFNDNLKISSKSEHTSFDGFSGKLNMNALTEDSKISSTTLERLIYDDDSIFIYSDCYPDKGQLEVFSSIGEYGNLEITLQGKGLSVNCDYEDINYFIFNNIDKIWLWGIGGFLGPGTIIGAILFTYKEKILEKIGWRK